MQPTQSIPYYAFNESGYVFGKTNHFQRPDFITKDECNIFRLVNLVVLSSITSMFGTVTNTINMILFYRQGFNTTTNISFFALAISDMSCLVTALWFSIALNPYLEKADIQFIPDEIQHLTGGWFHICSGRITSWITVFITFERCLGITIPLKVKQIVTLRRTTIVMIFIFSVNLSMLLPEYIITYWDWKFVQAKNRTLLGMVYRSYKDQAYGLVYSLTSTSGIMSYFFVILLTTFLVTKLAQKSKWRKMATGGANSSETVSTRDKKTMKMIIMISSVLIVCHIPGTTVSLVSAIVPDFMIDEPLANSYFSCWSISFFFDAVNSSVNIFLYYRMSTKYRQSFNELFSRCIKGEEQTPADTVLQARPQNSSS